MQQQEVFNFNPIDGSTTGQYNDCVIFHNLQGRFVAHRLMGKLGR